jgi:PII-like signaling protein
MKLVGRAKLVRIHFGEDDQWNGRPLYEAIVEEARRQDLAGATVYRGIEGYGASTRIHRKHLLTSSDLPIMVSIVDEESKIKRFLPTVEVMVKEGLVAVSDVEVIRYLHRSEAEGDVKDRHEDRRPEGHVQ